MLESWTAYLLMLKSTYIIIFVHRCIAPLSAHDVYMRLKNWHKCLNSSIPAICFVLLPSPFILEKLLKDCITSRVYIFLNLDYTYGWWFFYLLLCFLLVYWNSILDYCLIYMSDSQSGMRGVLLETFLYLKWVLHYGNHHTQRYSHTHTCAPQRDRIMNTYLRACLQTHCTHTHMLMHTPFHLSSPVWLLAMASNPPRTHHSPGHETLSNQLEALNFDQVGHAEAMGHWVTNWKHWI